MLNSLYTKIVLKYPKFILAVLLFLTVIMANFAMKLDIDVSADTLLLKGDKDLEFSRQVSKKFVTKDTLVITYSIKDDLLSQNNIVNIKTLSRELLDLDLIESISSIVNVPLLQSPPKPLQELMKSIPTLETKGMDKSLVKAEFLNSPIYKNNLVSKDFHTTAISLNLKKISTKDKDFIRKYYHQSIIDIRMILDKFSSNHPQVKLHLGGVDMITDDMVEYVKSDLKTFGVLIIVLLIIILFILFKRVEWVFIALFICSASLVVTSGFLSLLGLQITVVSSNFISLQLIMNMSLVVHLIIKYKELYTTNKSWTQEELLKATMLGMSKPSFFVVVTTIAGFSSLVYSNILPIMNFGWMMSLGLLVSLVSTFILFPLVLSFIAKKEFTTSSKEKGLFTQKIADIAFYYKRTILFISFVVVLFSISGAFNLRVENSFIDYFKKDTPTYQGMSLIDQKLGGTTPLDVILTFKDNSDEVESIDVIEDSQENEFDDFEEEFEETQKDKEDYWFTIEKINTITKVHQYLESQKAIGKVLSLTTMVNILKTLNNGEKVDGLLLALLYKELDQEYKEAILLPYINIEANQARISTRIMDSMPNLQRDKLIKKINYDLNNMLNESYVEKRLSGLMIMYNNMLQSLFKSQIQTIGVVILILFIMFLVLFRSLNVAIIAMIANILPVSVIFGFMGWMDIPLDMMTITIASISIGIAVDNTIHYIYRYKMEFKKSNDAKLSMYNSHASIGVAMFYTSVIIIVGFSVLVLSNFLPTIYFGVLTVLAMFMAILSDLLLLPVMLMMYYTKR